MYIWVLNLYHPVNQKLPISKTVSVVTIGYFFGSHLLFSPFLFLDTVYFLWKTRKKYMIIIHAILTTGYSISVKLWESLPMVVESLGIITFCVWKRPLGPVRDARWNPSGDASSLVGDARLLSSSLLTSPCSTSPLLSLT